MTCLFLWLLSAVASGQDTGVVKTPPVINVTRCKPILVKGGLQRQQQELLLALRQVRPKLFASKEKRAVYAAASAETGALVAQVLLLISDTETQLATFEAVVRREMPHIELQPLSFDDCVMIYMTAQGVDPEHKT